MIKGIVYYTDCRLGEPIYSIVQGLLLEVGLPTVSCSLNKPIDFGQNVVVQGKRSYPTYIHQIRTALETSTADHVFFCEHDCLYPKSHFDFVPPKDIVFYYNENVWRWWYDSDTAIRYDRMLPLSCLCVNREFALEHYRLREEHIAKVGLDKFRSREPRWARRWGYEPGTKKKKRGGFSDDDFDTWRSELPVIDIRHKGTFSSPKITLDSFKHKPTGWREIPIVEIPGWDLRKLFDL